MINLKDQEQRKLALDPFSSFIIEAPAGSGKTELLTKRFLRLLSLVKNPEEILAITFTRKAASEMRNRIVNALLQAKTIQDNSEISKLALEALKQNEKLNWNLLENPNRLKIQTIDSFSANLAKDMPVLSNFGSMPKINENPYTLYKEAIDEIIDNIDDNDFYSDSLQKLLIHLDNKLSFVKKLLIDMLSKRDQWLPHIFKENLKENLENGLKAINNDCLEKLNIHFPKDILFELEQLIEFASNNLALSNPTKNEKEKWLRINNLLLTQDNTWRSSVDKRHGFPSSNDSKDKEQKTLYKNMKQQMKEILRKLNNQKFLLEILIELRKLPSTFYNDKQWEILIALLELLPIVAAKLKLVFKKYGEVDFIEVAIGSLMALGTQEKPTDLALTLDYKIHHILIDEFQDTSIMQFRLFEQLISEWHQNDGRTIFIVGDSMQSIYRFRNAEVGLFLKTFNEGIGHIQLTPLKLSVNFRSNKQIIDWINQKFSNIFPLNEDIAMGAVTYNPASSYNDEIIDDEVLINFYNSSDTEKIANIIFDIKKQKSNESIAILVRARTHLESLLPVLRQHEIPYQALEIDKLNTRMVIQDLLSLTKAILHPADRISWLSILRAPFLGLSLKALHIIASKDSEKTIWQRIQDESSLKCLNETSIEKLNNLKNIIKTAWINRGRKTLRSLIEEAWISLEAPAYLKNEVDLKDANAYFKLLDELSVNYDIKDFIELEERTANLFASCDNISNNSVQIMTIHKAKGLEFDTVILPCLDKTITKQEQQLLFWMERPRINSESNLILAPIKMMGDTKDSVYNYLHYAMIQKNRFEEMRLMYVAVTRAKKRLYLFGNPF